MIFAKGFRMDQINQPTSLERSSRRAWQTPRVIQSALGDSEVKVTGVPTPDSHFLSNDYGSTS